VEPSEPSEPSEFEKFATLTKKVIAVPREEILKREAEYQQSRKKSPKNGDAKAT
jgi:hypothetical protein